MLFLTCYRMLRMRMYYASVVTKLREWQRLCVWRPCNSALMMIQVRMSHLCSLCLVEGTVCPPLSRSEMLSAIQLK